MSADDAREYFDEKAARWGDYYADTEALNHGGKLLALLDAQSLELQAVRAALRELVKHISSDCDARACRLPCHLLDKANKALTLQVAP